MRFDKLTTKFQQAFADAQSMALANDNGFIEPQHLLAALVAQEDGGTASLLSRAGVAAPRLQSALFDDAPALPAGLAYRDAVVSPDEERALVVDYGRSLAPPLLSATLRPLAVLAGLGARALADGGRPLLHGPGSTLLALRIGITGR